MRKRLTLFLVVASTGAALILYFGDFWCRDEVVRPEPPPPKATAPMSFPATTSHLWINVSFPKAAIATHLNDGMPKTFSFDVTRDGVRVHGSPSRDEIAVVIVPESRRVAASTAISGRVQVEKKVLVNVAVGIDVSGDIKASFSPAMTKDWTIEPHLDLSAGLNQALAKTPIGDIDITGLARDAVMIAVNKAKNSAEDKLGAALNVRGDVEKIWNQIPGVHQLASDPPTWLRITPRKAILGQFGYTENAVESRLALVLETSVFVQETAPEVQRTGLAELDITSADSDEFNLSIPIAISYAAINEQLKERLARDRLKLPEIDSWVKITGAAIEPYGEGVLLTVDFNAKKGFIGCGKGRLFIVGSPVFDAAKSELRVENLEYTSATSGALLKSVEWLSHSRFLDAMKSHSVINLSGEIEKAKAKANEQLEKLTKQFPKAVSAEMSVKALGVDKLVFAKDGVFAIISAKGGMSARLQK